MNPLVPILSGTSYESSEASWKEALLPPLSSAPTDGLLVLYLFQLSPRSLAFRKLSESTPCELGLASEGFLWCEGASDGLALR